MNIYGLQSSIHIKSEYSLTILIKSIRFFLCYKQLNLWTEEINIEGVKKIKFVSE